MRFKMPIPSPKQKLFLTDNHRHVGFGGARGGGKSMAVMIKAIILCLFYAGIKVMIVRKSYPELIANHIKPLKEMLRINSPMAVASYNDSRKEITFPNGSEILFRYCSSDSSVENFQGTEVDVLFIDEATNIPEEHIKKINACVRGTNNFPKRTYYTMNPGGISHAYFKRIFIDRIYNEGENPEDYSFIKSLVTDNEALLKSNPEYVKELESLPPRLKEAWLYGSWDIFTGQVFEEYRNDPDHYLDKRWTHVIEPFDIPSSWQIYRSYDYGYSKPFSTGYWTCDSDGVVYRIAEFYGCTNTPDEGVKWDADRQFREMKRFENSHPQLMGRDIIGVADPAIWNNNGVKSLVDIAAENGVYFYKGDNNRLQGLAQMHYRMAFDEKTGKAMMYVFKNCKAFIRTIPLLLYSEKLGHEEDVDTTMEDHCFDECRYFLQTFFPMKPRTTEVNKNMAYNPFE